MPALTVGLLVLPVLAGLAGTIAPAFGLMPAIGAWEPGLGPFRALAEWPGLWRAVLLSLVTGVLSTALALAIVAMCFAAFHGSRGFRLLQRALSPLLSVPHAAAGFGLAFLIAPSGWIARALSPWATGWDRPPDLLIVQDPAGLALIAGLVAKEVPFLLLIGIAALGQVAPERTVIAARALGYGREAAWFKLVLPQLYPQMRLAVYAVLVYAMTTVDMAMILGPNTPPTLSVQITRWMVDPDLAERLRGSAAAVLQTGLVLCALLLWRGGEWIACRIGRPWVEGGGRGRKGSLLRLPAGLLAAAVALAIGLGMFGMAVWSVAGFWSFPDLLPDQWSLRSWRRALPTLAGPIAETVIAAFASTLIALILAIGCLEAEQRHGLTPGRRALWLLYLPLIVPQIAFLPGLQTVMLALGVRSGMAAVIAAHLVFVFPYLFLSLSDPYRAFDRRFATVAQSLGAGRERVMWRIRLPMLLAPILTATAVGMAVSVGQYLPTLLIGGGRVQTLTTEAVSLASGGERRVIGVYTVLQSAVALLPFAAALAIPRLVYSGRREMIHG